MTWALEFSIATPKIDLSHITKLCSRGIAMALFEYTKCFDTMELGQYSEIHSNLAMRSIFR